MIFINKINSYKIIVKKMSDSKSKIFNPNTQKIKKVKKISSF